MAKDGIDIKRCGLHCVLDGLLFCSTIDVQPFQPWAMGIEHISIFFDYDGYTNFQHFSQFHVAPRMCFWLATTRMGGEITL